MPVFWLWLICRVVVGGGKEWRHQGCLDTDMGMWRWEENYFGHRFGFVLICSSIMVVSSHLNGSPNYRLPALFFGYFLYDSTSTPSVTF